MSISHRLVASTLVAIVLCSISVAAEEESVVPERRLPRWSNETQEAWWRAHPTPQTWEAEARFIRDALLELQGRDGLASAMTSPDFTGWVGHLHWLHLFPEDWPVHPYFRHPTHQRVYRTLSLEPALRELLLSALTPEDDAGSALEILCGLYGQDPDRVREYAPLAVALAVVFDQALPEGWPHPYVRKDDLRLRPSDPGERFRYLVAAHRRGMMMVDPRRLSVRELTFVVDTRLDAREFQFAHALGLNEAQQLRELYDKVEYQQERIRDAEYVWPHGVYRLPEIARRGGICADRAYFTSQVGKAYGIPTILFLGQGRNGTHAWVGFREGPGRWKTDVARYQSDMLPMGMALDPQTGQTITDVGLQALVYEDGRRSASGTAAAMVEWALLNPGSPFYRELLAMARGRSPDWAEPWRLEARWLDRNHPPLAQQEGFWREWVDHFRDDRSLSFEGKKRLLLVLEAADDRDAADRLREEILAENRWKRFDLAIGLAADEVFRLVEKQAWAEAEHALDREMRRFRARSGGHLFYNLLLPYAQRALQHGRIDQAAHAAGYLQDDFFSVRPGTILHNDLQLLQRRIHAFVASRNSQQ